MCDLFMTFSWKLLWKSATGVWGEGCHWVWER